MFCAGLYCFNYYSMKSFYTLFALVIVTVISSSCNDICTKRVDCPAYDGSFLYSWFPYTDKNNNTFVFEDADGNREVLTIDDITATEPYKLVYESGMNRPHRDCEVNGTISSKKTGSKGLLFNLIDAQSLDNSSDYEYGITLQFRNMYLRLKQGEEDQLENTASRKWYQFDSYNTISLNGKNYNETLLVSIKDSADAKSHTMDQLYIAKGHGIVGYRTYPDLKEFWLQ